MARVKVSQKERKKERKKEKGRGECINNDDDVK
jgi:hypothetical protein